jgi:Rrf2 family protein
MRTLSKRTQYSLRALYALTRANGRSVLIAEMARQERIPKKFLEQILLKLKAQGLVESKKGKGGGYMLARKPEAVTLGQVIRMIGGAPWHRFRARVRRPIESAMNASMTGIARLDW